MSKKHWLIIIIILLFPVVGILFYPHMPEQMRTHWGGSDVPDDYMAKFAGTFMIAIILMIIIAIILATNIGLTRIFAKNYSSKKPALVFDYFTILISLFLLTTYTAVLAYNAGAKFSIPKFMSISSTVLTAAILMVTFYVLKAFIKQPLIFLFKPWKSRYWKKAKYQEACFYQKHKK